jgi:putative ABC transport system permease protein
MQGIYRLAFKLLTNDRTKFSGLIVGITFSVFLMLEMTSLFAGILTRSSATVLNVGAPVWVMDPSVQTVANSIGMPDYVLNVARSIPGVKFAVPLYSGAALIKLPDGVFQSAYVMGLDDTSLYGRPQMVEGDIHDIYAENAFIAVYDSEIRKLEYPHIGSEFELNDHRGRIVGIAKVTSSGLFGIPTLYTTYNRALQYIPNPRFTISYVLLEPKTPDAIPGIKKAMKDLGYVALTKEEFVQKISDFYKFQTGVGMNILIMTTVSFIVGLSISGQTFYTFIIENLEKFGALKAIGATNRELISMVLFQAAFTCLTGYGLGIGLCTLLIALAKYRLPDYAANITYWNLMMAFGMVIVIAAVSSYIGVRRVLRIEPFDIFRS